MINTNTNLHTNATIGAKENIKTPTDTSTHILIECSQYEPQY